MGGADGAYFIEPGPDVFFFRFHNVLLSHNAAEVHH